MIIPTLTKDLLIYSAIIVVVIALLIFAYILTKIYKIKKTMKKETLEILSQETIAEGHLKVVSRSDLGEPIFELRDAIQNPINDEIVEFSINTIIKNNFLKVLMLGHKTAYEMIAISNKAKVEIDVIDSEVNHQEYNEIINKFDFPHQINFLEKVEKNIQYDIILLLSSNTSYLSFYEKYIDNLKEKGMFLIANVTKNKQWKKEILNKISKTNQKYDILKWNKGFILIVK